MKARHSMDAAYVVPMFEIRSEIERLRGVKILGQSRSAWYILRQKALWVASGNGDGRAEKPRYDVPQGVGVKNRYKAELTNQRRGSGPKTQVYSAVPHGGAEWWRYTAFCRLPFLFLSSSTQRRFLPSTAF